MFNKTYISVTFLLFLYLSLWMECRSSLRGVKGQGPGEEVTPQETAQLKLGLRLAFTVKIVNPSSPHRFLRKHMLCLNALVAFQQTLSNTQRQTCSTSQKDFSWI